MADGVIFSATGQSPPANTNIWTDELAIGASTAHAQIVKLADPTLDSTAMLGVTSGGLHAFVVNTALAISGNSTAIVSTASAIRIKSTSALSISSVTGPVQVADNGGSLTIDGNSTAIVSTASAIRIKSTSALTVSGSVSIGSGTVSLSAGLGSSNPIITRMWAPRSESTWANITLTSTTAAELFSSGGSTVINITDLQATVGSTATGTLVRVYDNTTAGTLLFAGWCGPEGGINATFLTPRRGSSGENIVAVLEPASTVFISAGGFRSS